MINRRDDILHGRGSMTWNSLQTNENDKARGDKKWVTYKDVHILLRAVYFGLKFSWRRSYNIRYLLKKRYTNFNFRNGRVKS